MKMKTLKDIEIKGTGLVGKDKLKKAAREWIKENDSISGWVAKFFNLEDEDKT